VLTANVEKRLAALKSSTQINESQRLLLRLHCSEANASGMVSNKITGFPIPESRQKSRSTERIKLDEIGRSERPFLKLERTERLWSRGDFGNGC
jgi:hypothetical protein